MVPKQLNLAEKVITFGMIDKIKQIKRSYGIITTTSKTDFF